MKYKTIELSHTNEIIQTYGVNSLMAKVIESKKIDQEQFKSFMDPHLVYHDFSLFEEADETLERIEEAIANKEKICIYGDYDCDGILATTILVQAFHERGVNVGYHIPNRFTDGYGLNTTRVEQMAEKGYSLIITVDNGIKAFDAVEKAGELGIDVIITDHHAFDGEVPVAYSIIHTKMSPKYPFKEICGGFIAYKLAAALLKHHDPYLFTLASITTISDMMPLLDENRSLVRRGLQFMKQYKYSSLELLKGNRNYDVTTIGFTIAPRINAFGRLPELVNPVYLVKYFLKEADPAYLEKISNYASKINSKRQSLTTSLYKEAVTDTSSSCLFYGSENMHEGLVGLVAGKYTREYEQPAFVMHYNPKEEIYKGSARGIDGFNIYNFFTHHEELFVQYGGHAKAGGFTITKSNYPLVYDALMNDIKGCHFEASESVIPITLTDTTIPNVESLDLLAPFGEENKAPLFILEDVSCHQVDRLSEGKHLKFHLGDDQVSALAFNKGQLYDELVHKDSMTLVGTLSINVFRGNKSINFIVEDIL